MAIYPVVLAGGNGTRLWPLSRANHPKQFLDLLQQGKSLLQSTLARAQMCSAMPPMVIASQQHRFLLKQQLLESGVVCDVLLEPLPKNTAASILIACFKALSANPSATLLILPSDHYFPDVEQFKKVIQTAEAALTANEIVLLGIKPNKPATQYGYLKTDSGSGLSNVSAFVEKPEMDTAQRYVDSGEYLWNSGIVISKAQHLVNLFVKYQPDLYGVVKQACDQRESFYGDDLIGEALGRCESVSFDYAILEKANNIRALSFDGEWDDLGSWDSLLKRRKKMGMPESFFSNQKASLFLGVDDLIVVDEDDLLLVANPDSLTNTNAATQKLAEMGRLDLLNRLDVSRPWGTFKVLSQGDNFLVKELSIAPYSQISLQSHGHRSEHWVVVEGQGEVELNGQLATLTQGQSISIGVNDRHRLSNHTRNPLRIIEVQAGTHLDESDIVRYEDKYDRPLSNN